MTPIEIAYFKHFMYDKGLTRSYLYFYRKNPLKGSPKGDKDANPESVEQFFLQTTVEDVIMKAFMFYPTNITPRKVNGSYDYWKGIDDQWQSYMQSMAGNYTNDTWPILRKTFAILRQNWDIPGYWKGSNQESTEEVYKRMNIDLPLPERCWPHGVVSPKQQDLEFNDFDIRNACDGDIIVREHKCEDHVSQLIILFRELEPYKTEEISMLGVASYCYYNCYSDKLKIGGEMRKILVNPDATDVKYRLAFKEERDTLMKKLAEVGLEWDEKSKMLISLVPKKEFTSEPAETNLPEIDFVEFDKKSRTAYMLTKGTMSLNSRSHSWRITINREDTKEIRKKQVKYAMIGNTKLGETMLMLCNNPKGMPLTYNTDKYYNVNSREFCEHLMRLLFITDDLAYLNIDKVLEKTDSITYKITKQ